uniref:E3 ubiquitin-protein ligase ZNRF1 n=1 Tax=Cuerna arida TaxID=1464854 RepID=A0A1B6FPU3_9HEMI
MGARVSTSSNSNSGSNTRRTSSAATNAAATPATSTATAASSADTSSGSPSSLLADEVLSAFRLFNHYPHRMRSFTNVPSSDRTMSMDSEQVTVVPSALDYFAATNESTAPFYMAAAADNSSTTTASSSPSMFNNSNHMDPFAPRLLSSQIYSFHGIKCPACSKVLLPQDFDYHIVMCLTKPKLSYNEDILQSDKGECVICLEDLTVGTVIARLPCLCIYHKKCIDQWFKVNRSCPEHPGA